MPKIYALLLENTTEIICEIESTGLKLQAFICDQGGSNMGLAKQFGIDVDEGITSFQNPSCEDTEVENENGRRIVWVYDFIHLYKVIIFSVNPKIVTLSRIILCSFALNSVSCAKISNGSPLGPKYL